MLCGELTKVNSVPQELQCNGLKSFAESVLSSEGRKDVNSFHLVISTPFMIFGMERVTVVVLSVVFICVNDTVHGNISEIIV